MRSLLSSTSSSLHLISNRYSIITYYFRYFQSRPEIFSAATTKDGATAEADTNPFRKDITSARFMLRLQLLVVLEMLRLSLCQAG